jgi:predicted HTH transcriptional regulator
MAFPNTDMPGHRRLLERVTVAIYTGLEAPEIDFKESAPWDGLRWRIVRTLLGMANIPYGGLVLIGVSERGDVWDFSGITTVHYATYDADVIAALVDAYASPSVRVQSAVHKVQDSAQGVTFLVIAVDEFDDVPIVCKKTGPNGSKLVEGEVYVRPPGVPRTIRVQRAEQMHDLLESAAEKRARRILETSRRLGLTPTSPSDEDLFTQELAGL